VVRITTNLVQVDAVVTDKSGKQVTDLRPEDFEVLEDGKPQKITNFSYISAAPRGAATAPQPAPPAADRDAPPAPSRPLRPADVCRTIALVVNDLGLSFPSVVFTRDALKKFVDEQMQPCDLVAVFQTGKEIGTLQQFTSDKRQIYAAIERVRYNHLGGGGMDVFDPVEPDMLPKGGVGGSAIKEQRAAQGDPESDPDLLKLRRQVSTVGALSTLRYVISGLEQVPGRKSLVLFSDGIPLSFSLSLEDASSLAGEQTVRLTQKLIDAANRASVVVYTVDPRGLLPLTNIRDNFSGRDPSFVTARCGIAGWR
jgi:VWFA-related protein